MPTLAVPLGPEQAAKVDWNAFLINLVLILGALAVVWLIYWLVRRRR
jgi:hypothetical protein